MTGAGIMDAKRALQDTGGDVDAAKKLLREKGMANADKRAGRVTTEGKVGYRIHEDGSRATIVGIGCETEPVSNNDAFMAFAKKVLDLIDDEGVGAEAKLEEERKELPRSSARTSRSSRPPASSGSTPARSRATRIRPRTSSASSSSSAAARPSSPARSRCTSRRPRRSTSLARTFPRSS